MKTPIYFKRQLFALYYFLIWKRKISLLYSCAIQTIRFVFLIKCQLPSSGTSLSFQIRGCIYKANIYFFVVAISFSPRSKIEIKSIAYQYNLQNHYACVKKTISVQLQLQPLAKFYVFPSDHKKLRLLDNPTYNPIAFFINKSTWCWTKLSTSKSNSFPLNKVIINLDQYLEDFLQSFSSNYSKKFVLEVKMSSPSRPWFKPLMHQSTGCCCYLFVKIIPSFVLIQNT